PLPESATRIAALLSTPERWAHGGLTDALLKLARDETSLDVKGTDFKLDMVPAHLFMNFRIVDEHGRQLGMGRNLAALKAELGAQARGAFQALAGLNVKASAKPGATESAGAGAQSSAKLAPPSLPAGQRYTAWTF